MSRPTCIKSLEIQNIRGIQSKVFTFRTPELFPNKINLLVAPNGFGKSSIAHALECIKPRSLDRNRLQYYNDDDTLVPAVKLKYLSNGTEHTLNENQIGSTFSISVIRSRITAAIRQANSFVQHSRATASLALEPITICSIPPNPSRQFNPTFLKNLFGRNGKILPNLSNLLNEDTLLADLLNYENKRRFTQTTFHSNVDGVAEAINQLNGNKASILSDIKNCHLTSLEGVPDLKNIAQIIENKLGCSKTNSFLQAIIFVRLYRTQLDNLKKLQKKAEYENALTEARSLIASVNSNPTWLNIRLRSSRGKLVSEFPAAQTMSNGQRDLFSFICQLIKARFDLDKPLSILVIDEVFDYLDECNLLFAQYFVREYVAHFKSSGRELFPLILTHLDPRLFSHSGFGKKNSIKVHILDNDHTSNQSQGVAKLVEAREDSQAKETIEKHFFHYRPLDHDASTLFASQRLPPQWAKSHDFYQHCSDELLKYQQSDPSTDFVAACVGLRIQIEERAYGLLTDDNDKTSFIDSCTKGTNSKLEFSSQKSVVIPESHRVLGLIYNDMLHFKPNFDYISAIISKMKNPAIRAMILKAVNE